MELNLDLPEFAEPLFLPYRYKVLYGGRGSAKSYSIAKTLLFFGLKKKEKILCAREFQNSISDSVMSLLEEQAKELKIDQFYSFSNSSIRGRNGTEFLFRGIRHNIQSIKSIPGITKCWIEEAQTVSQSSWDILVPTIRDNGSEIWVSYNPENEDDPTHKKFVTGKPPEDSYIRKVNWDQNKWFPDILRKEKDYQFATNPELAEHIWGGECRSHSDAQVFKGKYRVDYFEPQAHWVGPYLGADWGFSKDPTTLVEVWIDNTERNIYIRREAHSGQWLEDRKKKHPNAIFDIELIPTLFEKVPSSRTRKIRGDSSRPETISFVARKGFQIEGAKKWAGSVEDGIEFIKSFREVIIHPDCPRTKEEFKNYSYKVDRLTQDVTSDIIDAWNHCIDAIRYALEPLISRDTSLLELFLKGNK